MDDAFSHHLCAVVSATHRSPHKLLKSVDAIAYRGNPSTGDLFQIASVPGVADAIAHQRLLKPDIRRKLTMWLSEQILYRLVRLMSSSEAGHSEEMKSALENDNTYADYRSEQSQTVIDAAARFDVPIKDKVVLDLGCYDGAISVGYLSAGASHVYGVDIDEDAVATAREQRGSEKCEFHVGTVEKLPLDDNSVDTILCYDVFEHVEHPQPILEEVHRVLRPGGKMLIGTWGWKHPFAPHLWSTMPVPWAHVFFSERTVLRTCRRVYHSDWYVPNMHDFDENGERLQNKYEYESIPTSYLNKFLVTDFERVFRQSSLDYDMHPQPFGSKYAAWTKIFLKTPWIREFVTGYLWVVLNKPAHDEAMVPETSAATLA